LPVAAIKGRDFGHNHNIWGVEMNNHEGTNHEETSVQEQGVSHPFGHKNCDGHVERLTLRPPFRAQRNINMVVTW